MTDQGCAIFTQKDIDEAFYPGFPWHKQNPGAFLQLLKDRGAPVSRLPLEGSPGGITHEFVWDSRYAIRRKTRPEGGVEFMWRLERGR